MTRTVRCPTCQRPVAWSPESPFRPFCSERCKLIDLGAWASEQRSIPGEEVANSWPDDQEPNGQPPRH